MIGKLAGARFRLGNTRQSAVFLALALAFVGFAVGALLLLVAPMARAGQGPFAFFRSQSRVADAQIRAAPVVVTPPSRRPELWQTPVASSAFPSPERLAAEQRTSGAVKTTYDPGKGTRVVPVRPIRDALGRPVVSAVVTLTSDDDLDAPEPSRPDAVEPTQLAIAAAGGALTRSASCVLSMRGDALQATGAVGEVTLDDCRNGAIPLGNGKRLVFAVDYQLLPNHMVRSGAWQSGGVLGRTDVWVSVGEAPPA